MYLLFRFHHILPSQYYGMGFGERTTLKAFIHYEVEKRNEEMEKINESVNKM